MAIFVYIISKLTMGKNDTANLGWSKSLFLIMKNIKNVSFQTMVVGNLTTMVVGNPAENVTYQH